MKPGEHGNNCMLQYKYLLPRAAMLDITRTVIELCGVELKISRQLRQRSAVCMLWSSYQSPTGLAWPSLILLSMDVMGVFCIIRGWGKFEVG